MRRALTDRRLWFVLAMGVLLPLAVLLVISAYREAVLRPFRSDFAIYYSVSTIGLQSGFGHIYDEAKRVPLWNSMAAALGGPLQPYPVIQPPTMALFTVPFALLPFPAAYAIWLVLIAASLLLAWWLGAPGARWVRGGHLVALLALLPMGLGLYVGQAVFLVFGAVIVSWWLLRQKRDVAAGLVLLLILLKPQEAILVPFALLLAGRRRAFATWAIGTAVIGVVCLLLIGGTGLSAYLSRLGEVYRNPLAWQSVPNMSLPSLLGNGTAGTIAQAAVAALTLFAAWRQRKQDFELPMAIALVGSLLMTPYLHEPDTVILVAAGWLYLRLRPPPYAIAALVVTYIAIDLGLARGVGFAPLVIIELAWLLAMAVLPAEKVTSLDRTPSPRRAVLKPRPG
jgi:alpha-1,2-mannosyltransferase